MSFRRRTRALLLEKPQPLPRKGFSFPPDIPTFALTLFFPESFSGPATARVFFRPSKRFSSPTDLVVDSVERAQQPVGACCSKCFQNHAAYRLRNAAIERCWGCQTTAA